MTNTPATTQVLIALSTIIVAGAFVWPIPRHTEPLIQQRSAVVEAIDTQP